MKKSIVGFSLAAPLLAFAAAGDTFFSKVATFTNQSIGLLLGIATLVFLVGVIQYVIAGGDEKKTATAKTYMLYGIIGLVVMVAAWGIVNLLVDTLGFNDSNIPTDPYGLDSNIPVPTDPTD